MGETVESEVFPMRRFLSLFIFLTLLLGLGPQAKAAGPNGGITAAVYNYALDRYAPAEEMAVVRLRLDGQDILGKMPGVIYQSRTLAPLRLLAEGLGAEVEWVPDMAQVVVRKGEDVILLTLGSATAYVNDQARGLPDGVPATMVSYEGQGYTMVPLRFFSETLGCRVDWEQPSYTASMTRTGYIGQDLASLLTPLDTPVDPGKYLIALDAGHGGPWSGAYYEETAEKDLNLSMVLKLDRILRALGYNTILTRQGDEDVGLKARSVIANNADADIFVSIHCNAAPQVPDFQGLYVYHYPGSVEGQALAQAIQAPACAFTGAVDRNINSANFSVVRESKMPAVLVETGFMSCHEELLRLKDEAYQTRMAQGVAQGIIRYLNGKNN